MAGQVLGAKAVTCPLGKWRQSRSCTTRCERESGVQKYPCPPRCNIINSSILALPCVTHLGSVKATCHNDSRYSNQVNNPLSFCAACARDRWHITLIATRWEKGRGKVWGMDIWRTSRSFFPSTFPSCTTTDLSVKLTSTCGLWSVLSPSYVLNPNYGAGYWLELTQARLCYLFTARQLLYFSYFSYISIIIRTLPLTCCTHARAIIRGCHPNKPWPRWPRPCESESTRRKSISTCTMAVTACEEESCLSLVLGTDRRKSTCYTKGRSTLFSMIFKEAADSRQLSLRISFAYADLTDNKLRNLTTALSFFAYSKPYFRIFFFTVKLKKIN